MTYRESPEDLLIRAKQAHDDVWADPDRFRPAAEALVAEARSARQPEALALALRALAWAERARQDDRSAIWLLDEACRIARRHRLHDTLADLLMTHADISQELGQMAAARRDLRAAALVATGPRMSELNVHTAVLLQNTGRLADAAAMYHRVLADPAAPARRKVQSANNLALIESEQGRYGQALRRLEEALEAAAEIGPAFAAIISQSRAWVTVQSGRFAAGLRMFEDAAHAYRVAGLPLGEHYIEYADALMELRLLPEAVSAARRAVAEFTVAGIPLMAAEAQLRVAQLAMLAGDGTEAVTASASAAAAFRQQTRPAWRARTLVVAAEARLARGQVTVVSLREAGAAAHRLELAGMTSAAVQAFLVTGKLASALGQPRQAVAALTRAAALTRGTPVLVRLRGRLSAALAARLRSRDDEALAHCRRGLSDLARHRDSLPSVELRALASGHGAELGLIGLDIVVSSGSAGRVLNWMERSRAAALLAVEPPEFDNLRADLTALRTVHTESRDERMAAARQFLRAEATDMKQAAIESRIRQATWRATATRRRAATGRRAATPVTLGQLREVLAGRTLAAYGRRGDDLIAVVIGHRRGEVTAVGPLGPVQEQLRAFLFAVRRLAGPRPPAQLAAARASADLRLRKLTELLLSPLRVNTDTELVVIPVASLQGVPWSALHGGPVSLAPSATFWALSATAGGRSGLAGVPSGAPASVVLVAGPELPGAVEEVNSLAGIHAAAVTIIPPASTAEAVAAALTGADLAHLACHGTLRSDNPMFSSLFLSDGPLTVQELYTRGLAPHRLVLAACQSGAGVSYAGDEVLGFVSALLARGTAGILASTAAVPDVNAVSLMTGVHRHLARGATLAHALHAARQSQDTEDPGSYVNWCTFNAHGAA